MLLCELIVRCEKCPRGEDGDLQICHLIQVWTGGVGVSVAIATCERCGYQEECDISYPALVAEHEERSSRVVPNPESSFVM